MTNIVFILKLGEIAIKNMKETGILASVTIAQGILESDYGTSYLAVKANNLFGMKCNLSGNTWVSAWDGVSKLTKITKEDDGKGNITEVLADFRSYPDIETSVRDHSLYLLGARKGSGLRYPGLKGEKDYRKAIQIIKDGGYATDSGYVSKICKIIEMYDLTFYDNGGDSMSKKVFIGVGHGGSDPGASKYLVEKDVNLNMALACKDYLEARGVVVKMSRTKDENDPIAEEVKECNAFNPDLAIDVHNNAGGGDGFEAICSIVGGVSKELALNIEKEVKAIGQNSRGIKTRKNKSGKDYFAFIRSIKAPSVIVEGVFVDNAEDVKIADTIQEQKIFGEAYARGILATLGIKDTVVTPIANNSVPFKVKVEIRNLNIRSGAGTDNAIKMICPPGTYTITEVKSGKGSDKGWGRLKSGAGWISLDFATLA